MHIYLIVIFGTTFKSLSLEYKTLAVQAEFNIYTIYINIFEFNICIEIIHDTQKILSIYRHLATFRTSRNKNQSNQRLPVK